MLETIIEFFNEQLATNQFFQGGALIAAMGILFASLRTIPSKIFRALNWFSFVVIDVPDKDESFRWVDKWLASHAYSQKRARNLTVYTRRDRYTSKSGLPKILLSPAPGTHYFFYKYHLVILYRERKEPAAEGGSGSTLMEREVFSIKILGRNREIAKRLLEEARAMALPDAESKFGIQSYSTHYGWSNPIYRPKRPLESVILPDGQSERIIADMQHFLDSEKWYNDRGIPWRRGYLFDGTPGNGKSSLAAAVASHLGLGICTINMRRVDDDELLEAMSVLPKKSLLLLEDIDCLYQQRASETAAVTFSGMLNALDGVAASEGRILIMTTNKKHLLDAALIRPGRCDVHEHFGDANHSQAVRLFQRFFPDDKIGHFELPANTSMAAIQGHLLKYHERMEDAVANISELEQESTHEPTKEQEETRTGESN
jgi:chaperone BCS1